MTSGKIKLSDLEKAAIVIWIILGGLIGVFLVAPIIKQGPILPGIIGLLFGVGIAYFYFHKPRKRKHKRFGQNLSWDGDKFVDIVMNRIYEVYGIRKEPEANEETEGPISEIEYDDAKSMDNDKSPPMVGAEAETDPSLWQSLSVSSKMLSIFTFLWPMLVATVRYMFPQIIEPIKETSLLRITYLFPCCLLTSINGFLILMQQNTVDDFNQQTRRARGYITGILAILLGCGAGAYLIFVDILHLDS